jgi:hypothetical protein
MIPLNPQNSGSQTRKIPSQYCQDDSAYPELLYYVTREKMGKLSGVINAPIRLNQKCSEDPKLVLRKVSENHARDDESHASHVTQHDVSSPTLRWAHRREM